MPLVKIPVRWVGRLPRQSQNPHARVVVVHHLAQRRLPNELVIRRPQTQCRFLGYSPLRGCRQRDAEIPLQPLQSFEWHTAAITELRDHRRRCLVILFRARLRRFIRRVHLPAAVTAQALHLVPGCLQRRPSHDPHQRFRFLLAVDFAHAAFRTDVSRVESFCAAP